MRPILFSFGPFHLFGYGAMIVLGGLLSFAFLWSRRRAAGLDEEGFWCLLNLILVAGFLGGKLLYLVESAFPSGAGFRGAAFSLSTGFSVFGALAAVALAVALFARSRALPFLGLFDHVCWMLPFWHGFGRLGCFLAGCCHGRPTDWPWGVAFRDPRCLVPEAWQGLPLHPTQLLEAGGDFALAAVLWPVLAATQRGRLRPGLVVAGYCAGYGALRIGVEALRGDTLPLWGPLSAGQGFGLAMMACGGAALAWRKRCFRSC